MHTYTHTSTRVLISPRMHCLVSIKFVLTEMPLVCSCVLYLNRSTRACVMRGLGPRRVGGRRVQRWLYYKERVLSDSGLAGQPAAPYDEAAALLLTDLKTTLTLQSGTPPPPKPPVGRETTLSTMPPPSHQRKRTLISRVVLNPSSLRGAARLSRHPLTSRVHYQRYPRSMLPLRLIRQEQLPSLSILQCNHPFFCDTFSSDRSFSSS